MVSPVLEEPMAKKKTGEPPDPGRRKPLVVQVRGSEAWKEWAEELAQFDNRGLASLVERAFSRYAKEIGFSKEAPER